MLDCCMATFIRRTASATSCTVTLLLKRMRASASARAQEPQCEWVDQEGAVPQQLQLYLTDG